tara:strand:+ start:7609 stop:8385 length:777 start_codon:yes stop_codon:yes gene_type:complete
MEFTVNGTEFSLSPDEVRRKLKNHAPAKLHQYTVTIDSQVWPVKQAFSIATGLSHSQFQSQTARRQLKRFGFAIDHDERAELTSPVTRSTSPSAIAFDADQLVESDTVTAALQFTWLSAGQLSLDDNLRPQFPALPSQPGLYRFTFVGAEGVRRNEVYIGESKNLRRRVSQYRNAVSEKSTQRTSRRLHKQIVRHLEASGHIEFSIATEVLLGVDEEAIDLVRASARRVAENAAVLLAQLNPMNDVLNIDVDPTADED